MRVPDDILFRQYEGRPGQAPGDNQGAPTVDGLRASGDTLSSASERRRERYHPPASANVKDEDLRTIPLGDERRQQNDRRQQRQKVLLDTRTNNDRRRSPRPAGISVKA